MARRRIESMNEPRRPDPGATSAVLLDGVSDQRGEAFSIPAEVLFFLGGVAELHVASVVGGAVRGHHVHQVRKEALVIFFTDGCELAWHAPDDEVVQKEIFQGRGGVFLLLEPGVAHAVRNPGREPLFLTALSDRVPGLADSDTQYRELFT